MLEVRNLVKSYNKNIVLNDISFTVNKGEVIGIIGESGCGKSTLLRCISRLERINSGAILFDNIKIDAIKNYYEKVGMVFQQFNLFNNLSVLDNIILAPVKLKIFSVNEAKKRARKLLKDMNILDKENAFPSNLLGGEKQRVAIARTLIMNPSIILFDEPTSSLDPKMTNEVLELIKKLKELHMTIILVSHELSFVKEIVERIIFIENGKIEVDTKAPFDFKNHKNKKLDDFLTNELTN